MDPDVKAELEAIYAQLAIVFRWLGQLERHGAINGSQGAIKALAEMEQEMLQAHNRLLLGEAVER
jgi:hypothetical protein